MNKARQRAKKIQRKALKQARRRKIYEANRNRGKGKGMKSKQMRLLQALVKAGKIKIVRKKDEGTQGTPNVTDTRTASSENT